jgi:hypothetical protein
MPKDFFGLPTRAIENNFLRLEFLVDAGPRIVRLSLAGSSENVLAELPRKKIETPLGDYFLRGGHRLWHSPEAMPRTYLMDNAGVTIESIADGVRLRQPTESLTGITKSIEIRLDSNRPLATITHRLQNDGTETVEFAPWAITMLPLGGVAILPQNVGAIDTHSLLPNRNLVFWSYTRVNDARLELNDDAIRVRARADLPPCKIGYFNRRGWIAYWRNNILFVKRFTPQIAQAHPDYNCNAEMYCNDEFIELETLAPLARIAPGQSAAHVETWELRSGVTLDSVSELMK